MRALTIGVLFVASTAVTGTARAQTAQRLLSAPPEMDSRMLAETREGSDVSLTLELDYAEHQIFDPATGNEDSVRLRSYNGGLVGPTLRMKPGQTMRIRLVNKLPVDNCILPEGTHNIPNCFNVTNLHTHGFHISPAGNSDNVLLEIEPQTVMEYEFNLPEDHPAGTFWYHPHRHGSTALQVSSGLAGALIVEGTRSVGQQGGGAADIDTILKAPSGGALNEQLIVFEQVPYACFEDGEIVKNEDGTWRCPEGAIGQIEQYDEQFGPLTWPQSGRYTMLNGLVQPTMTSTAGELTRWRMVHAGVRDTIEVRLTKSNVALRSSEPTTLTRLAAAAQAGWADEHCRLDQTIPQFELAVDGLTRRSLTPKSENTLQPGYRSDALVVFPEPGVYCVLDDEAPARSLVNPEGRERKGTRVLALVEVRDGDRVEGPIGRYIVERLLSANPTLPEPVRERLRRFELDDFSPHQTIADHALTGAQDLIFSIDGSGDTPRFGINSLAYDPDRVDRLLRLGDVEEWRLTSTLAAHPFHIHVNPFEVVRILNPQGQSIIDASGRCTEEAGDRQYCDAIGTFRDTMFVKQGYDVFVRSRYKRYIGEFVLHCHILDHEDQGMMQNVKIVPRTGGAGGNHE